MNQPEISQGLKSQIHIREILSSKSQENNNLPWLFDSDFWYGYRFYKEKDRLPKKYWLKKIEGNIKRDRRNRHSLKKEGWVVLRV